MSDRVYCRICGIVRDVEPGRLPLCRHGVIDPPSPPERTVPIPPWHPLANGEALDTEDRASD